MSAIRLSLIFVDKDTGFWSPRKTTDSILYTRFGHFWDQPLNIQSKYKGQIRDRATSASFLRTRLDINRKYQTNDFDEWLFNHVTLNTGDCVLDIGCGEGKQAIPFARMVGTDGTICALDISEASVETLQEKARREGLENIHAAVQNMEGFYNNVEELFPINTFDIVHSSYALYYADDPILTLSQALSLLRPEGQAIVFTPMAPHGMVEFAARFHDIPKVVTDCFSFGVNVLEPYFNECFATVETHVYRNIVKIPSSDEFMTLYRATTYYDAASDSAVFQEAEKSVRDKGTIDIAKNGFLLIGKKLNPGQPQ